MSTRRSKWFLALAAMAGATFLGGKAFALPTVQLKGDSGTLEITTTSLGPPLQTAEATAGFNGIYGTPPFPTITPVTNGWKITFTPSSAFFASANNHAGLGEKTILSGELSFDINFNTANPIHLTTNIYEDGIWASSGNGIASANSADLASGVSITETDDGMMSHTGNSFATSAVASYASNGTWSLFDQIQSLPGMYSTYHVVIDNDLLAEVDAGGPAGSASIAKKDFTIIFTTDGTTGGGAPSPEPASIGVLALGTLGLLGRRRNKR